MKRVILSLLIALGATSITFAGEQKVTQQAQQASQPVQEINVTAIMAASGDYIITCTSPEDGPGVLILVDMETGNILSQEQVGVINGVHQKTGKTTVPKVRIHFHMNGYAPAVTTMIMP